MARSTLRASEAGIEAIRRAYKDKFGSQDNLADAANCRRQTIGSLLKGNPVDNHIMNGVCKALELEQSEVVILEEAPEQYGLDELVREVRGQAKRYIDEYCSTMRVLNMTQKIELSDLYTNVNILQKLTRSRQLRIDELLELSRDKFELLAWGEFVKRGVPGLEAVQAYDKLMVFGKPGAGKTTFLKFVALQCSAGELFPKLIPLFVPLKEWAEAEGSPGLLQHLISLFASYGIAPNAQVKQEEHLSFLASQSSAVAKECVDLGTVQKILRQGRVLILLDGLDEVREADTKRVIREIETFSRQFSENRCIVTCRIAAKDYVFEKFTEIEVADFNDEQITTFIGNWFRVRELPQVAERLMMRLKENRQMRELVCSPILLTLLCLVFEESGELSPNRAELYKRGLDLLLSRWDATRGIERDQVYQRLSLRAKEEMLSKIAYNYFEQGKYFFKQESVVEEIGACLYNLPKVDEVFEDLRVIAQVVLKSIEAQHGLLVERANDIYSFSHLTFQEYLTARWIRESRQDIVLSQLVMHLNEPQWRDVFLLSAEMLNCEGANQLLLEMQHETEHLLIKDDALQSFLVWLLDKTGAIGKNAVKPVMIRAIYINLNAKFLLYRIDLDDQNRANIDAESILESKSKFELNPKYDEGFDFGINENLYKSLLSVCRAFEPKFGLENSYINDEIMLDCLLVRALYFIELLETADRSATKIGLGAARASIRSLTRTLDRSIEKAESDNKLQERLIYLREKFPTISKINSEEQALEDYSTWRQSIDWDWKKWLRDTMLIHRNIGQDWNWNFDPEKIQQFNRYMNANQLIADCLNADCYISRHVRQDIEATMLMPQSFIDEYRQKQKPG